MDFISILCLITLIVLVVIRASRPDLSASLNRWILAVLIAGFGLVILDHINQGDTVGAVLVSLLLVGMIVMYRIGERRDQSRIKRKSHYIS